MAVEGEWRGFLEERKVDGELRTVGISARLHQFGNSLRGSIVAALSYEVALEKYVKTHSDSPYASFLHELSVKVKSAQVKVEIAPKGDFVGSIIGTKVEFELTYRSPLRHRLHAGGETWTLFESHPHCVQFVGLLTGKDIINGEWRHAATSSSGRFRLAQE